MKEIKKPWGKEVIWAWGKYIAKTITIKSGHRMSLQYHKKKEETIYVIKGFLDLQLEQVHISLGPGKSIHIPKKHVHRMGAKFQDVTIIEVSTPYMFDVVRLEDDYGRAKNGPRRSLAASKAAQQP